MNIELRTLLLVGAIILILFIYRKLKKAQLHINEAFFWIVFSFIIFVLALFPEVGMHIARKIGIISAANLIFFATIALLIIKTFLLTIKVSTLEQKVVNLTQEIAIKENMEKQETLQKDCE